MKRVWKILRRVIIVAIVVAVFVWAFMPAAVSVDVVVATRGPMQVTVNQEGRTRVRELYTISAPLAGELQRIDLDEGDAVVAGKTVLARIEPVLPGLLDARAVEEAQARVRAAEATLHGTAPAIVRAEAHVAHAKLQFDRARQLVDEHAISQQELEAQQLSLDVASAELKSARASEDVARFQVEQAKAALLRVTGAPTTHPAGPFEIISPIDAKVLRVLQESGGTVAPGTRLLDIADVTSLEAVIDVLSQDAVRIHPGARVYFDRWGGDAPLLGTVRRIEPSGFTKVSALGVEEQRVNVIADFTDLGNPSAVGDQYRVDARIVIWEEPDVLKIHNGALFREGDQWAVYVVDGGKARLRTIKVGRMSGLSAQVLDGLSSSDKVILHPSDKVRDGVKVSLRGETPTP